jgi:hypothetical protein
MTMLMAYIGWITVLAIVRAEFGEGAAWAGAAVFAVWLFWDEINALIVHRLARRG